MSAILCHKYYAHLTAMKEQAVANEMAEKISGHSAIGGSKIHLAR